LIRLVEHLLAVLLPVSLLPASLLLAEYPLVEHLLTCLLPACLLLAQRLRELIQLEVVLSRED